MNFTAEIPISGADNVYLSSALAGHGAGICIIPAAGPKSREPKKPFVEKVDGEWTWAHFQREAPGPRRLRHWFGRRGMTYLGAVCGKVSGNLELFEFDCRETYDRFVAEAAALGLGELVGRIEAGYCEDTPGGGVHWFYRCDEIAGNTELAKRPDPENPGKFKVLIETRGEGGFAVVAPTVGLHANGKGYVLRSGSFATIATIHPDERRQLWDLARVFDDAPVEVPAEPKESTIWNVTATSGTRLQHADGWQVPPGADFDRRGSWDEVLDGWEKARQIGGKTLWRRPGKSEAWSASTGYGDADLLYVFSTSTGFQARKWYRKSSAYALMFHGGDWGEAVKALHKAGYGIPSARGKNGRAGGQGATNGHAQKNGHAGDGIHSGHHATPALKLKTISVRDIEVRPVEYLAEPHLPIGMLINLAGDGGQGKSLLTLSILADLSRNRPPLGLEGTIDGPVDVLLCAAEDGQADTVKPRLLAAGADIDRIEVIEGVADEKGQITPFDVTYVPLIRQHILDGRARGKNFRVLVIDPITTYIGRAKIDDHRDAQLKPALELLSSLAQEMGITVICCIHLNKAGGGGNAIHRIMGGAAYVNSSRLTYVYGPHPDDESKRVLTAPKANLPTRPWSIAVRVEEVPEAEGMRLLDGHADHLDECKKLKLAGQLRRLVFEGKSDLTASDVLDPGKKPKTPADHVAKAAAWLNDRLKDGPAGTTLVAMQGNAHIAKPWPAPGVENRERMIMGQVKWWRETILKGQLGGSSRKLGMAGPWFFTLPHHQWPPSDAAIRAAIDAEREGDEAEEGGVF